MRVYIAFFVKESAVTSSLTAVKSWKCPLVFLLRIIKMTLYCCLVLP